MKKYYLSFIMAIVFLQAASAQQERSVRFVNGDFVPGRKISTPGFSTNSLSNSLYKGKYFVLLQFSRLPSPAERILLEQKGVQLGAYISGNAYFAAVKESFNFNEAGSFSIISADPVPSLYKLDKALAFTNASGNQVNSDKLIVVSLFPGMSKEEAITVLRSTGATPVYSKFVFADRIFIKADIALINAIAALPFVASLNWQSVTDKELNYHSTAMHAIGGLQWEGGQNLNGKGVTVGVGDNGEITTAHIDFNARVINRVPYPVSFHGVHVSGTVSGGGIFNPLYKGMAPRSTLISHWFSDIVTAAPVYVTDNDLVATNNSYTDADDSCAGNRVYDILSNYVDNQMRNYNKLLHVFAVGNDGQYTCAPYPDSFGTVKSGWQAAKNVLSVGAIDSNYKAATFTSRGPVHDGRIKPEIVAKGVYQLSTRHNFTYGVNSGTSMASPVVTGAAALLNEKYRKLYAGAIPRADLVKALLCNTADDLGEDGPDYTFGFGMLNTRRAIEALDGAQFFTGNSSGLPQVHSISVPADVRRLKVMLYWADTAAAPNAASALVNDLDLTVADPSSIIHIPLVPDPAPGNVKLAATPQADHLNNIEQVTITDPAPGNYDINISAYAIPLGTQDYVVTYQFEKNGITVEHPFGGETWVPGQTENIRWTAFGDESSLFTVSYSADNGNSWTNINTNVPANARSLVWTVPAAVTNEGRIRVTRNNSGYTDMSDTAFVILGQTTLSQSVPCDGFVQLNWTTVTGASSYDIMQLDADTMKLIANTASLNYLVSGLSGTTEYWFAVRAKNNTNYGRRSVAVRVTPSSGTCSLSTYDNNFKALAIASPISGRQLTSSALTGSEQVRLTIKNLDNTASSGSYDLYYQVNGGPVLMESSSVAVAALASTTYSFTPTAVFAAPGIYHIKAWVKRPLDAWSSDDTAVITIKHIANPSLSLPVTDDFETAVDKTYSGNTLGLDGVDKADFRTNTARGRLRSFVNTGFAQSGSKAMTMDQFISNAALTTDSLLMTYNIATYSLSDQLRLDFAYKNHGQANNPNNKVWIRANDGQPWIYAYDLVYNQAGLGQWKQAHININDVLDTVLPAQVIGTSFQVKFGQQGNTSANLPFPDLDQDDGYTFDDVKLQEVSNDAGITAVINPAVNGCNMAGSQTISLRIKNYTGAAISGVPVYYRMNNGAPVMETIASLLPGDNIYNFSTPVNLVNNTNYSFDFWISAPGDIYQPNDSILNYELHTSTVVSTYPYLEGFEADNGGWYTAGQNTTWAWGTPAKSTISKAANGARAWVTGLSSNYANREFSYLYSPCFDLSGLTQPVLSFSHIFEIEDATPADYCWVEYSTDGVTWNKLGTNNAPGSTNWYNDPTGAHQWRISNSKWHVASIDIPVRAAATRFRIVMSSNSALNYDGVGIDDIHIFEKALIYTGAPVTGLTQTVSGSSWTHFTSGGRRIASINPNGFNLGNTTVDGYPYTGTVRVRNNQYYLNRNIVIRPANQPGAYTTVRFYFTEAEAQSLIAATGCGSCSKPADPYELGVTKYSGTAIQENGTHSDNFGGVYSFILPGNTEIIPYDNGYYAEFPVNSYSEFWLNNGGVNNNQPLPVRLVDFAAVKQSQKVLLSWTTENEMNTDKYIIERSDNGRDYIAIGTVNAANVLNRQAYRFTDILPMKGWNYYRLRILDKDGAFDYSPVRRISFEGVKGVNIYPNPVTGKTFSITTTANGNRLVLYDPAGKVVKTQQLQGRSNLVDIGGVSKGIYLLRVFTDDGSYTEKLIVP